MSDAPPPIPYSEPSGGRGLAGACAGFVGALAGIALSWWILLSTRLGERWWMIPLAAAVAGVATQRMRRRPGRHLLGPALAGVFGALFGASLLILVCEAWVRLG